MGRGAQIQSTEPLSEFLAVPVELTDSSEHFPELPLVDSKQKIRLRKRCVQTLREFCVSRKSELLRTREITMLEADTAAPSAAAPLAASSAGQHSAAAVGGGGQRCSAAARRRQIDSSDSSDDDGEEGEEEEGEEEEEDGGEGSEKECGGERETQSCGHPQKRTASGFDVAD
eukprot:6200183-Pleurochrysis_carterae.AAC.1